MTSKFLLIFLVLIFLANIFGEFFGWYWTLSWYDAMMHMAGGAWTAFLFVYLFQDRLGAIDLRKNTAAWFLFCLGFSALAGVLWEFFEFGVDHFSPLQDPAFMQQPGVADTMADLLNDLMGSAAAFGFMLLQRAFRKASPRG